MDTRLHTLLVVVVALCMLAGCAGKTSSGASQDNASAQAIVDQATRLVEKSLENDPDGVLRDLLDRAQGVLILPDVGDVSLILSIGGGNALLLSKTAEGWNGPAFMVKSTVGLGVQAGATKTTGILLYMHEADVRYLMRTGATLQGQARVVFLSTDYEGNQSPEFYEAGEVYFVGERSGLYAGMAVDSGGYSNRTGLNEAFTGVVGGGPRAILYDDHVQPEGAAKLRALLNGQAE
ncbi:lipid-binding SYLF domain-containing protein [Pseudodesulfovibrio sediminis]|uniref:Ysc84 actin-binding domain-containing protein n=1 Tax=Pseudodesulfovibrio sediminis TaxID=2810563 RepID=A0ABM7P4F0_9BACT|nr:lipid-binding SYLF domain-containing protein [Pseudodesulfovibrio sediminis]BCS87745.1 hypothetical protein PSDVSF_09870 [Pseudodesulfovibrio sediminis]